MENVITRKMESVSIVIPVYNEAGVIAQVIQGFYDRIMKSYPQVRLIVAEDGSVDGTKQILQRLSQQIPFELVTGETRKGYTQAFKDALGLVKTALVFFSDSDGQHDPADFFKLLDEFERHDIVSGFKCPRRDPFHRILLSWGYNTLIWSLFGLKMRDIDSGFKLIRQEVIHEVLPEVKDLKHCVMSEFILKAHLRGYRIKEIPVRHYPRPNGTTNLFQPHKLPGIVFNLIKGLINIRCRYSRLSRVRQKS